MHATGLTISQTSQMLHGLDLTSYVPLNLKSIGVRSKKIYFAFIRPVLKYSDSVWDNATAVSQKQLEAIHIEAARIITGATEKLLSDLGRDSLQKGAININ